MTDKTLLQDALKNKIILATPTTLIVVLRSVAMSWQQHSITENALKILDTANDFYDRVNTFSGHIDKMGSGLKSALKGYNEAVGSWEGRIIPAGRKLEELRKADIKETLPDLEKIDNPLRELKRPEKEE